MKNNKEHTYTYKHMLTIKMLFTFVYLKGKIRKGQKTN